MSVGEYGSLEKVAFEQRAQWRLTSSFRASQVGSHTSLCGPALSFLLATPRSREAGACGGCSDSVPSSGVGGLQFLRSCVNTCRGQSALSLPQPVQQCHVLPYCGSNSCFRMADALGHPFMCFPVDTSSLGNLPKVEIFCPFSLSFYNPLCILDARLL